MKKIKESILFVLFVLTVSTTFAQTKDSLYIPDFFENETNLYFEIAHSDVITFKVYNQWGDVVRTFYESTILPAGSYNVNFLAYDLPISSYYIALYIGPKYLVGSVIKIGTPTAITNGNSIDKISLFPNPTNTFITVPFEGNKSIVITDLNGRVIKSFTTEEEVMSITDLSVGQYLFTIFNDHNEMITTQKIIISE